MRVNSPRSQRLTGSAQCSKPATCARPSLLLEGCPDVLPGKPIPIDILRNVEKYLVAAVEPGVSRAQFDEKKSMPQRQRFQTVASLARGPRRAHGKFHASAARRNEIREILAIDDLDPFRHTLASAGRSNAMP